jgi:hypothetical protein
MLPDDDVIEAGYTDSIPPRTNRSREGDSRLPPRDGGGCFKALATHWLGWKIFCSATTSGTPSPQARPRWPSAPCAGAPGGCGPIVCDSSAGKAEGRGNRDMGLGLGDRPHAKRGTPAVSPLHRRPRRRVQRRHMQDFDDGVYAGCGRDAGLPPTARLRGADHAQRVGGVLQKPLLSLTG